MLICVAGMVGCGKTTMTKALSRHLGIPMALESVDDHQKGENPWLDLFYAPGGMSRYALPLQLHMLAARVESLRQIKAEGGDYILDRSIAEDAEIFARGLYEQGYMSEVEYRLYERLYTELGFAPAARPPHLLVYLHGPLDVILQRIHDRGRESEQQVPVEYWRALHERYARWVRSYRKGRILPLDIREYDLIEHPECMTDIAARVERTLGAKRQGPRVQLGLRI